MSEKRKIVMIGQHAQNLHIAHAINNAYSEVLFLSLSPKPPTDNTLIIKEFAECTHNSELTKNIFQHADYVIFLAYEGHIDNEDELKKNDFHLLEYALQLKNMLTTYNIQKNFVSFIELFTITDTRIAHENNIDYIINSHLFIQALMAKVLIDNDTIWHFLNIFCQHKYYQYRVMPLKEHAIFQHHTPDTLLFKNVYATLLHEYNQQILCVKTYTNMADKRFNDIIAPANKDYFSSYYLQPNDTLCFLA